MSVLFPKRQKKDAVRSLDQWTRNFGDMKDPVIRKTLGFITFINALLEPLRPCHFGD